MRKFVILGVRVYASATYIGHLSPRPSPAAIDQALASEVGMVVDVRGAAFELWNQTKAKNLEAIDGKAAVTVAIPEVKAALLRHLPQGSPLQDVNFVPNGIYRPVNDTGTHETIGFVEVQLGATTHPRWTFPNVSVGGEAIECQVCLGIMVQEVGL